MASIPGSSSGSGSGSGSAKQHSHHPISQLPMTTRKKLSHLRAQIKRQASKAARSRLEKQSSVNATGSTTHKPLAASFGLSFDSSHDTGSKVSGDGFTARDLANQANSSSIDSPTTSSSHLNNQSSLSPTSGTPATGGPDTIASSSQPGSSSSNSHQQQQQQQHSSHLLPGSHHHHIGIRVHQKNFKQKLIALVKKFRTDGGGFDNEEQYREALERELMKAAAGRGSREIEELLEEDLDVEGESGSEPEDWDNISASSTPKPSLRPFFSSTTLDKI